MKQGCEVAWLISPVVGIGIAVGVFDRKVGSQSSKVASLSAGCWDYLGLQIKGRWVVYQIVVSF